MVRRPQLRTPLARAVVPVVAGIGFFALLGLALWGVAAFISRNADSTSELLVKRTFEPGPASSYARIVSEDGPVLFPDPIGTSGDDSVVLDHVGDDPLNNWHLYLAYPADRPVSCKITQVRFSRSFTDCEGRTIDVTELALPARGIGPVVSPDGVLSLDLRAATGDAAPVTTPTT